jgi:hypothetical protein
VSTDERPESRTWIEELLSAHADDIFGRELRVQCEFDPLFPITKDERLEAALVGLFRFVFSTVPDGCEVFVASARRVAPVASVESGSLIIRWQAVGNERSRFREKVTALRPIVGDARTHAQSKLSADLKDAFEAAGWEFELSAMAEDREMWVCASRR